MSETKTCPKCQSKEIYPGYGMAVGGIGFYEICLGCGHVLSFEPDRDAVEVDQGEKPFDGDAEHHHGDAE